MSYDAQLLLPCPSNRPTLVGDFTSNHNQHYVPEFYEWNCTTLCCYLGQGIMIKSRMQILVYFCKV